MELRVSFRNVLQITVLAVGLISASSALASEKLELTHTVYLGGLYVGNVKTDIIQKDGTYRIESRARTSETWNWLFDWIAEGQSQGLISAELIRPEKHTYQSAWNGKKRGAFIDYSSSGQVEYKLIGKPNLNLEKYTPLDLASIHQSMDPMSMMLVVSETLQKGGPCVGTYPLFDGRRRFDVTLSPVSEIIFGRSDYSVFEGKAIGCKIEIDKKGGFKRNSNYELPQDGELILWVGSPVDGGRIVPVRMEMATSFGVAELHLAKYSYGDTKLASKNAE
ncbi:MAG: DUF3108 domain-containing protein [Sneathiella sp.]|nr:DUF3108 domain-containing protein [Sneathiella sp.]